MKPELKKYLLYISIATVSGLLLFVLVQTVRAKNTGFEVKTLWDWMQLLIIPLFLAGGAYYLNRSERENERVIAIDRQREAAFQSYLDRMSDLLLKEKLRTSKNGEAQEIARVRTLSILRELDVKRKGIVLRFLQESKLIMSEKSVINLTRADLENIELSYAYLQDVNLSGASLERAKLKAAQLQDSNLKDTNLEFAYLPFADLSGANLENANLRYAKLRSTNLRGANLQGARLEYADLGGAKLEGANLEEADLTGAMVFDEQLATVKSLKKTVMPDETEHE